MAARTRNSTVKERSAQTGPEHLPRATELAYQRLSLAIITLELAPGSLVSERVLSAQLDVGRLSLIPALHRLAETGLVSMLPRRGILIAPVEVLDVQQVFDARSAIEGALAEFAATRATLPQVRQIALLVEELDEVGKHEGDYHAFLSHDRALHMALAELSRNRFLYAALERVWMVNLRLWHLFFHHRGTIGPYYLHHDRIIAALERRDGPGARNAVVEHIAESKRLLQTELWE